MDTIRITKCVINKLWSRLNKSRLLCKTWCSSKKYLHARHLYKDQAKVYINVKLDIHNNMKICLSYLMFILSFLWHLKFFKCRLYRCAYMIEMPAAVFSQKSKQTVPRCLVTYKTLR